MKKPMIWISDESRDIIKAWFKKKPSKDVEKANDFEKDSFRSEH